ncbi:MAG TPA: sigma factor, partial [Armatimonadota bacterium]|nr:sigma factor [Armatimonadota bacterium]
MMTSESTAAAPFRIAPRVPAAESRSAVSQTDRLDRAEEVRLVRRAQEGDQRALDRLVHSHIRLVYRVARAYRCRSHSFEDLVQEGT